METLVLKTFGKQIQLKVYARGEAGSNELVLDASGLRVDFNINNTMHYNRGTFMIYNLKPSVIKEISNGEKFASLEVGLHGGVLNSLGDDFYITNATTETILPNTITTLYCMSGKRRSFLEKQITTNFKKNTLKEFIQILVDEVKEEGISTEYVLFPNGILNYRTPDGKTTRYDGSIEDILKRLAKMYHFQYYLLGSTLRLVFRADTPEAYAESVEEREAKEFYIDILNLRANPVVGVSHVQLEINLTPDIIPGDVFDTNNFITASNDAGLEYLTAVTNDIRSTVTKYSKFQVYNVVNRGSNYTDQWHTIIQAFTAKDGNRLSTNHFNFYGIS